MFFLFLKSIFLMLIIFCLIMGIAISMYYAIRYIEEHTYAAKYKIEKIIRVIMILHLIPLFRGLSILLIFYSLIIQVIFYNLLTVYPDIPPSNPQFLFGSGLALINHFWFLKSSIDKQLSVLEVLIYFILIIWTTPFCFFMSLSANDDTLPNQVRKRETWIGKITKRLLSRVEKIK